MESVNDTEIGMFDIPGDSETGTDSGGNIFFTAKPLASGEPGSNDDEAPAVIERTTETVVVASNDPKTFEQSGYEASVVFLLALIFGMFVWHEVSNRWHV